jgi:hypothetical protein
VYTKGKCKRSFLIYNNSLQIFIKKSKKF